MASLGNMCAALRTALRGLSRNKIVPRYTISAYSTTNNDATGQQPPNENVKKEGRTEEVSYEELLEDHKKIFQRCLELEDKYKRALSETESVRQRFRRDVEDAKVYGIRSFCKDLLPVADVLSKVNSLIKEEDQIKEKSTLLTSMQQGVKGIEAQLQQVFSRHGLVQINPAQGEKFDPKFHQSLFVVPLPKAEEFSGKPIPESGSIFMVSKCGYKLHEETIRPADVGIYE